MAAVEAESLSVVSNKNCFGTAAMDFMNIKHKFWVESSPNCSMHV